MINMTKQEEALLNRSVNPTTALKRFKTVSGNYTNMANSIGATMTVHDMTVHDRTDQVKADHDRAVKVKTHEQQPRVLSPE